MSMSSWWSLGRTNCSVSYEGCPNCEDTGGCEYSGLLCRGLRNAIGACQKKFSNTQWNCSLGEEHIFGSFVCNSFTRETAIVGALLSAGAALAIAEACHKGLIYGCPCIASTNYRDDNTTYLHQCNDNVRFATRFVRNLYTMEGCTMEEAMANLWNYELGYQAVHRTSTYCRCIGLSGSCVLQSCYEKAPTISEIACELRNKYDGSQKVVKLNSSLYLAGNPDITALPGFPVHLRNTPNLCIPSPEDNILGTRGRRCEPSISGPDSCSSLCCNNGFESFTYEVPVETCRSLGRTNCSVSYGDCPNCEDTLVFNNPQEKHCSRHGEKEVVWALSRGLWHAIRGCQEQFTNTLWNCALGEEHLFEEFVCHNWATLGIASACHRGVIDGCPCNTGENRREDGTTFLHTCNENVDYAIRFVKELYNTEDCDMEVDLVRSHNYRLGYEAVNKTSTYCRCTGLSGSCVVQTCYERAPSVDEIFSQLRRKYEGSQKVEKINNTLHIAGRPDKTPLPGFPVYLCDTPDLCEIQDTRGRVCDPHSSGSDSCNNLCCGRGFEEVHYDIPNEKCRFVWCCRIMCTSLPPTPAILYRCY
ncbi:Protein Wnt-4 [Geodia barretti]|uniref:Protein Wnt n=1 Tax=Geodia barretti TaxID=519541 RepID=A0AA35TNW2_GEOBA|nr:Protein Wnt-4 [Geodia barretti]